MTIKPIIIISFLALSISAHADPGPQPAKPAKVATRTKPINWNNTPFKKVLSELEEDFKVKIYNPANIEGIPLTGIGSNGQSITLMCLIITREEKGHAFLLYQNGFVFVSDKPFPPDLIHPQQK